MKNLQKSGFKVTAINDKVAEKCEPFKGQIEVKNTPKEVAESVDVVITGTSL